MSAKHTAGPWRAAKGGGGTMSILRVQGDELVAYIPHGWPKAQREANARLIAAAPDLLAALIDLRDDCVEYCRINNLSNDDGKPGSNHAMRRAAEAIAKAEGEQP